ncbi:MAG: hypothetical protein EP330_29740 [Deltaproteobacteria bacterium]|nr:MAG: hypothetical protein EP330_29740 [Deltaproteobacteria bacterium]
MLLLLSLSALAGDVEFAVGSYGRIGVTSDLQGGRGESPTIVSHGPRLELGPYFELDLSWRAPMEGMDFAVVVTPALAGDVFHYDGSFDESLALRNLYVEAAQSEGPLSVWAGSRMYRGDDIYLLNFWPMDDLNTTGGGARFASGGLDVQAHVGLNRLLYGDQFQEVARPLPGGVASEQVLVLDRQRTIASLRAGYQLGDEIVFRTRVYGELHSLPAGERLVDDPFSSDRLETLPSDMGSMVGVQFSTWGWAPQSFAHLWLRYATGLAAIDELAPSGDVADDERVRSAHRTTLALSGNQETDLFAVQVGAELSYYVDADGLQRDVDDRWELSAAVRPQVYATEHVAIAAEFSHQLVRPNGLNPRTEQFDVPHITKLSLIPGLQPTKGQFTRPRVYAHYTLTLMDQAAQDWFPAGDVRVAPTQHFVGLGAEWWLNSQRQILPE